MHTPRPWLGKLLVAVLMTPVIVFLPLVLCMLPFYIPAAVYAQFRAARYGLEKDNRWGLRLAAGMIYGGIQFVLVVSLVKSWGVDPNQAIVVLPACFGILGTTYLGMVVGDRVWQATGAFLMRTLRRLYGVERNEELPAQRLLEAAEWVFFLELPVLVVLLLAVSLSAWTP
jgi:hypothetical protein